jgi:dTDP-4-dehydrorhamnose reductase
MKIILLGSTGFLGSILSNTLKLQGFSIFTIGRSKNNDFISDFKEPVSEELPECDILINTVGSTDVDLCQRDLNYAMDGNINPCLYIRNIFELYSRKEYLKPYFINISSDQVYKSAGPHDESKANPMNNYGITKFVGENILDYQYGCSLRTNFFGFSHSTSKPNFAEWVVSELSKENQINLFSDVIFNPLYVQTLCDYIVTLLYKQPKGIFNLGCRDYISKHDFGKVLARELALDESLIVRCQIKNVMETKQLAPRPNDMSMDCKKFERELGYKLPLIGEEILKFIKIYKS